MEKNLKNMTMSRLRELMTIFDEKPYRGSQVFSWLSAGAGSVDEMSNLPVSLRNRLKEEGFYVGSLTTLKKQISETDGTRKYLLGLEDGNAIESVFMKYRYGNTLCVSSQAGCRMGCAFCASTIGGLCRGLTPAEMTGQIDAAEKDTGEKINHIVVMGSGEPFDNYDNLADFIRIITDKNGRGMSMRHITVSTCGIVPGIERFAEDFPQAGLAISLHAADDDLRNKMMPVNRRYPLAELIPACRRYAEKTSRRVTFEYTLIKGVNDSPEAAEKLSGLLRGMLCHVNIIPLNKVDETGYDTVSRREAEAFRNMLERSGVPSTVRRELGDDIDGACGQLRLGHARAAD